MWKITLKFRDGQTQEQIAECEKDPSEEYEKLKKFIERSGGNTFEYTVEKIEEKNKMKNSTNIKIPKKYHKYIREVWSEQYNGDGYWADLQECCICDDTECHFVHEWAVKDFLKSLQTIRVMEEEYVSTFGDTWIEEYRESLKEVQEAE